MALSASEVWRDYNIDALPASGPHEPAKRDVRAWAALFELIGTGGGPGLGYQTKTLLNADIVHAANSLAVVYGDATPANNGMYVKSGASGSGGWTRIADLPNGLLRVTPTGGSADAIVAVCPETPTLPAAKLYLFTPSAQNTGAVTIAVNGAPAVSIKNAFGLDLSAGALLENSQVLMAWSVDHYQLLVSANVDASSILAAAQAAAVAAEDSADSAASNAGVVAGTAGGLIAQTYVEAAAATIPTDVEVVTVMGRSDAGDAPSAPYVSRLSEPSHAGKFLSNGVWRELERHDGVYLEDFGGINALQEDGTISTSPDNITAITDAIDYCKIKRRDLIRISSGLWPCKSGGIEFPVGINLRGHGHSSSQLQGGSVLLANYDEATPANPFLHWTGAGQASNATGGGAQNLTIQKGAGKSGGTLINLTGVDDSNRPGYMTFQNLRVSGTNQGADTDYCIIHDGQNLNTTSTNGLRDVFYGNIWIDGWVVEGAQLLNATHAKLMGFTASPTTGGGPALRISGDSSVSTHASNDVMAVGLSIYGSVVLDNCLQCLVAGRMTDLVITGNCKQTTIIPVCSNAITFTGTDRESLRTTNNTVILDGEDSVLYTNNTRVVGARVTGFTAPTGSAYKGTWDPSTISDLALRQRMKAIEDALTAHGLIGA